MDLSNAPSDIATFIAFRNQFMMDAFHELEKQHRLLADMLVYRTGSRINAARWMCEHQT